MKEKIVLIIILALLFNSAALANYADGLEQHQATSVNVNGQNLGVAADNLANYYIDSFKKYGGLEWLARTQISGNFFQNGNPQWSVSTIQPFGDLREHIGRTLFWQAAYTSANNTGNIGLGYRVSNDDKTTLYGINVFYDAATAANLAGSGTAGTHQRVGVGLEYFQKFLETRANGYLGLDRGSGVLLGSIQDAQNTVWNVYERAMNGFDISVIADLSLFDAPWLKLGLQGYDYFATQSNYGINNADKNGLIINGSWQILPQLQLTGGYDFGGKNAGVGFNFNLLAPPQAAMFFGDKVVAENADKNISYKIIQPVQRNNTIQVEQFTQKSIQPVPPGPGTITVNNLLFAYDNSPVPAGCYVAAYLNGATYAASAYYNGTSAVISGLSAGETYVIKTQATAAPTGAMPVCLQRILITDNTDTVLQKLMSEVNATIGETVSGYVSDMVWVTSTGSSTVTMDGQYTNNTQSSIPGFVYFGAVPAGAHTFTSNDGKTGTLPSVDVYGINTVQLN